MTYSFEIWCEASLVNLYQVCSYDAPGVKTGLAPWVKSLNIGKLQNSFSGRLRAMIFGMQHFPVDLCQVCSNDVLGIKTGPALGVTSSNIL